MRVCHSVRGGLCVSECTWVTYVCIDVHGSVVQRLGAGACACAGVGLWLQAWRQEVWVCRGLLLCAQSVCASVHVCVVAGAGVKALMPSCGQVGGGLCGLRGADEFEPLCPFTGGSWALWA